MAKSSQVMKKPASTIIKKPATHALTDEKIYASTCTACPVCQDDLTNKVRDRMAECVIVSSETIDKAFSERVRCRKCDTTVRQNFYKLGHQKVNCLSFDDITKSGVYFVNHHFAFTVNYLRLQHLRLLRAREAPGQEAAVQSIFHQEGDGMPCSRFFRDNLLHALEGYAIAREHPDQVIPFDLDYPAVTVYAKVENYVFPSPTDVKILAFDGHFGIHRLLEDGVDQPRTVALASRPKLKRYKEHERSKGCVDKEKSHLALPNRTAGWHFVTDPDSRRCLGAKEHIVNELIADKVSILTEVINMTNVVPDLLVHDDNCTFEKHVKNHKYDAFGTIKHFVIDKFHMKNHKCSKNKWTRSEKSRCKGVNTSQAEQFNAWMRGLNFFLNGLRPASHRFWVTEAIRFYNDNLHVLNIKHRSHRTNTSRRVVRKKPARK
jgi:hypothetical protein